MAKIQVIKLEIIIGIIISVELVLPADSLKLIIVVGRSWIETELITKSIIEEKDALPVPSSSSFIALIPLGVDALPRPKMLDDILIAINLFASSFLDLNKNFINGLSNFASLFASPLLSKISIIPSQIA